MTEIAYDRGSPRLRYRKTGRFASRQVAVTIANRQLLQLVFRAGGYPVSHCDLDAAAAAGALFGVPTHARRVRSAARVRAEETARAFGFGGGR